MNLNVILKCLFIASVAILFPLVASAIDIGEPTGIDTGLPPTGVGGPTTTTTTPGSITTTLPPAPSGPNITTMPNAPSAPGVRGNGGPDGGPGSMVSLSPYVVAVCATAFNSSQDCLDQGETEASGDLAKILMEQYSASRIVHTLRVSFPLDLEDTEQIKYLGVIEERALNEAESQLLSDVSRLHPFRWTTEEQREQQRAVVEHDDRAVRRWGERARNSANVHDHWSHDWRNNTHTFGGSHALQQLKYINLNGWTNQ